MKLREEVNKVALSEVISNNGMALILNDNGSFSINGDIEGMTLDTSGDSIIINMDSMKISLEELDLKIKDTENKLHYMRNVLMLGKHISKKVI